VVVWQDSSLFPGCVFSFEVQQVVLLLLVSAHKENAYNRSITVLRGNSGSKQSLGRSLIGLFNHWFLPWDGSNKECLVHEDRFFEGDNEEVLAAQLHNIVREEFLIISELQVFKLEQ